MSIGQRNHLSPQKESVVDPDFELRRGPGSILLEYNAQSVFLPSVISSFFTQNEGALVPRAHPLDPPLGIQPITPNTSQVLDPLSYENSWRATVIQLS